MTVAESRAVLSTALLASAGRERVGVVGGLEAAWCGARAFGPAFTVRGAAGDNLALHRAIAEAPASVVVVADVQGEREVAHVGDVLARAARARGICGIVVNGAIRDRATIRELGYPVFHCGTSPRGPAKLVVGEIGVPLALSGVTVHPGDLIVADEDGVVAVAAADADELVAAALAIAEREREYEARIDAGETTLSILGLSVAASERAPRTG